MRSVPPTHSVTEADLQAYVDGKLAPERQREVEAWLVGRPQEAARVASFRAQKHGLRALFDPVLAEEVPPRLLKAAGPRTPWYLQRLAAGVAIALISGATGWGLRGSLPEAGEPASIAARSTRAVTLATAAGFAQRALVAHAVYALDQRRPVEVDAAHEDQLVAWLSKRMGAPMKPPRLQALGYSLEGGRLLPGGQGPVAQFMYQDADGGKLTLYVSSEVADQGSSGGNSAAAFRFAQDGAVNVFYWVDGPFGYAISATAERDALTRVSSEVYRQVAPAIGGK